jgi:hypothetical protein
MVKQDIAAQLGGRIRYTQFLISYVDLTPIAGSGVQNITLADQTNPTSKFFIPNNPTAVNGKILGVSVKHSIAFAGAGPLTAMTVSLGVTGAVTRFTSAFDIFQAVSDTALQETACFKLGQYSATQLVAAFTPTGGTLAQLTAGAVAISLLWVDVSTTFSLPA